MEIQRTESLDTIPSAGFEITVKSLIDDMNNAMMVSEFKRMEANGELKPEPLLMEDKSRFVLFPIKHNDVSFCILSIASVVHHVQLSRNMSSNYYSIGVSVSYPYVRSGRCTRRQKHHFGRPKSWIWRMITRIGVI